MSNLSFARIMYGTSEEFRRTEANRGAFLLRSVEPSGRTLLQELLRKAWIALTLKH